MFVRFQLLTASSIKMTVFWDVAPCNLVALIMEAVGTSETSVNFYQTTWHNIPEDRATFKQNVILIRIYILKLFPNTNRRKRYLILQMSTHINSKNCLFLWELIYINHWLVSCTQELRKCYRITSVSW
jgi:hypothetical protein